MDPMTMLALGGAISSGLGALFGGSDGQERTGFSGNQSAPRTLEDALNAVKGFGRALEGRRAPSVPSAIVQGGPAPARIPGLPFQIGGALGIDPAMFDRSLLSGGAPFQVGMGGQAASGSGPTSARLRSPAGIPTGQASQRKQPRDF